MNMYGGRTMGITWTDEYIMDLMMRIMLFVAGAVICTIAILSGAGFIPTLIANLTGMGLMVRALW